MTATSKTTFSDYLSCLTESPAEARELLDSLSISYSEFFRNPLTFAILETLILPILNQACAQSGRSEIRVWSAGCAAGQEAYSIAILLDEMLAERNSSISFRIFATDISVAGLESGQKGRYHIDALQNVRLKHLRGCFLQQGGYYQIIPRLRERIAFTVHDLLDEHSSCPPASIFGDFDLILCSNLLFYYQEETRRSILKKLQSCLSPHGYLVTGEVERTFVEQMNGFRAVAPPTAVFRNTHSKGDL